MKKATVDKVLSDHKETFEALAKAEAKVRKCRVCTVDLPPQYYFHCKPCKDKIESEEGSDDFS